MQLYRYNSTTSACAWEGITDRKFSRLRAGFGAQSVPPTAWALVTSGTGTSGTYDGLSEWSASRFTADGPGYYFVEAVLVFPSGISSEYGKSAAIAKNGTRIAIRTLYGAGAICIGVADTVTLTAGEYIQINVYHNNTSALQLQGGVVHIMRVS
jgi:hypothetical protein